MILQTLLLAAAVATPAPSPAPPAVPMPAASPEAGVPQSVTLQQAIDIAVAKSPVLAAARANERLTQIPVSLAKTAVFPSVSATATTTHNNSSTFAGRSFGSNTSTGLNVDVRQLIYDGGKVIAQIHQARANAVAGADTYQRQLETLSFNVAQAYFSALQAEASTQVAKQVVHENQVNEALVQAQVKAGVAPRIDLVTAHVPTVQAEVAYTQAQGTEASAFGAFANVLGLDPTTLVRPVNREPANPAQSMVAVLPYQKSVARALALRPDYLAAQSAVQAAQYNVQVQRSGYYPSLTGNAQYGTNSTTVTGTNFRPSSSAGLTLSIPIFDQGITHAQTEQARAQLDLADAQLQQTKLGVELNVQQALVGVTSDQAAVQQAEAALASAQESVKATQAQYRAGVTTLVNLLQAQVNLTSAETSELNAIYTLRQAEQTYIYALGESSINPTAP